MFQGRWWHRSSRHLRTAWCQRRRHCIHVARCHGLSGRRVRSGRHARGDWHGLHHSGEISRLRILQGLLYQFCFTGLVHIHILRNQPVRLRHIGCGFLDHAHNVRKRFLEPSSLLPLPQYLEEFGSQGGARSHCFNGTLEDVAQMLFEPTFIETADLLVFVLCRMPQDRVDREDSRLLVCIVVL